jgi:hypothetical protein
MEDFTIYDPELLYEKSNIADNAGDSEKAALYLAIAKLLGTLEEHEDTIEDLEKDIKRMQDYSRYVEFFNDCFARLNGHYPCPSVTSDYDCAIVFDAIEKGESE